MTVTVTIGPEIEAGLLAKAQARGMDLQAYLQEVAEQEALPPSLNQPSETTPRSEAVLKMLEFGDKYRLSLGEPVTRSLLHEGHRV